MNVAISHQTYGAWWSTPFLHWQGALAELHSLRLAACTGARTLAPRGIDPAALDFGVLGMTVPQKGSFYGLPWLAAEMGAPQIAGPTIAHACSTGARVVQVAASEIALGAATAALVTACDRVSNGPQLLCPRPSGPGESGETENWVLDNFARDPWAACAMVDTAENVATKWDISRAEQDDVTLMRPTQYHTAVAAGFHARFLECDVPSTRFDADMATLPGDIGVQPSEEAKVRRLKPVREGGTVTHAGQTHPADGNDGAIVASRDMARRLSPRPEIGVAILGFGTARTERRLMPAAPVPAAAQALATAGVAIGEIDCVTSHNPVAVNDIVSARETGLALDRMNVNGCSLVDGHPQAPTGLRAIIELAETLGMRGGIGAFQGCAAGDSAMAVVIKVGDAG